MKLIKTKKIAVVGAGGWGKNHIRTLAELDCLGGVIDRDKNKLDELSVNYKGISVYSDLEDALKLNFDGFIVATPSETHYEIGKKIIQNGFPLLIEKPLCLYPKQAEELVELADSKNINLMVGHVLLFHPAIQKIKETIELGLIGDLQYIYSNRLNLGVVRTKENVFWSLAPHDISIFNDLINSDIDKVESFGSDIIQQGIHDSTITSIKYTNGVSAHIFVSWLHPFKEHRIVVIGSNGMLSFEDSSEKKDILYYPKSIKFHEGVPIKQDGEIEIIDYEFGLPLTRELIYFINNLESGFEIANGASALDVIKVLNMASNILNKDE